MENCIILNKISSKTVYYEESRSYLKSASENFKIKISDLRSIANPLYKIKGVGNFVWYLLYYFRNCYVVTQNIKVEAPRAVEENFAAIASSEASPPPAIESSRPLLSNAPLLAF